MLNILREATTQEKQFKLISNIKDLMASQNRTNVEK